MKILLAGYNIDKEIIEKLLKTNNTTVNATPETFSAAYARISRDPRPIDEIRKDARQEVERTRRSNETIIFRMGHHSVAEHAVFNFDILGLSRYAMESLEHFRLASYTEKSQRYITLDGDFVVPEELQRGPWESAFRDLIQKQNDLYHMLFTQLKDSVFQKHADLAASEKNHSLLEGWAKEDARYCTALATEAQVGLTVNARTLELMLRRFASHPLREVNILGRTMYEQVKHIAPSIIIFHEANEYDGKKYADLAHEAQSIFSDARTEEGTCDGGQVQLVEYDQNGDACIGAALLHSVSGKSYEVCKKTVKKMNDDEKKNLFKTACQHAQFFDILPREFEYANLTFDMVLSAACFGQMKRHRMSSITTQAYDPKLGVTIPESITAIGMEDAFRAVIKDTNELYFQIHKEHPHIAPYILTNAHERRILMRTNVRELYHISRLREDEHAQWDIQEKSRLMRQHAQEVLPLSCLLMGGKDQYNDIYQKVYGHAPKVREAVLPGVRKIT